MSVKICLDDYHIKHGEPGSGRGCALALAITPRVNGVAEVFEDGTVGVYSLGEFFRKVRIGARAGLMRLLRPDRLVQMFKLSDPAIAWMRAMDETGTGEPIEFELTEI